MAVKNVRAVKIDRVLVAPIRHPIKAATLLYSAAPFVLRGPIYMIFIIMFAFFMYSFWAKKDEMVAVPMLLERESAIIESINGGLVVSVDIEENKEVFAGDLLASVQQTRVTDSSEQKALESKRFELKKELDKLTDEYTHNISQLEIDLQDFDINREKNITRLSSQLSQRKEQKRTTARTVNRRKGQYNLALKQFKRTKALYDSQDTTVTEFERAQEKVRNSEKSWDDAKSQLTEIVIEIKKTENELDSLNDLQTKEKMEKELKQVKNRLERDTQQFQDKMNSIARNLKKTKTLVSGVTYDDKLTIYKSTFNGLITNLHIKTGMIINPGTPLVTIVKDSAALEARLLIPNSSIGKIKRGQEVKIKYYAYPYQEYGFSEGQGSTGVVSSIATRPGGVAGKESMYVVKVALNGEFIKRNKSKRRNLEISRCFKFNKTRRLFR